jgi:hypothetical protein
VEASAPAEQKIVAAKKAAVTEIPADATDRRSLDTRTLLDLPALRLGCPTPPRIRARGQG